MLRSTKLDWENRFFKSAPILTNFNGRGGLVPELYPMFLGRDITLLPLGKKSPLCFAAG